LSDDGSLLGVTTYVDAEVELKRYCSCETLYVPKNTVLLDESLYGSDAVPGRLRYTMAHECAHHILWRDEPDERKRSMRTHSMRTSVYRGRRGNSEDVQTERQADALAAALLMPPELVGRLTERFARGRRFVSYDGKLNRADRLALTHISGTLGVSRTALIIRLRQLGYLKDMPRSEYHDPTEVWCDG
jgi:Zn-dependent peptidase ImmA (M78 family)